MRILRLLVDEHHRIELHPALTVVGGLAPAQRATLRRACLAAGTGLGPATPGMLEAHGVLLDLDQASLDLLEVGADPAIVVVAAGDLPGPGALGVPAHRVDADRAVLDLARQRHRAAAAQAQAQRVAPVHGAVRGDAPLSARSGQVLRAEALRRALGLHAATDAEPVRVALDQRRDAGALVAAGAAPQTPAPGALAHALAGVGLAVGELDLSDDELARIADDWLDEHQRDVGWAVGARVELQGLDASLAREPEPVGVPDAGPVLALHRAREAADVARRALAAAIDDIDHIRSSDRDAPPPGTTADDIEAHVLGRLAEHRRDRLAGSVPMVLDGIVDGLDDADPGGLLGRIAAAAGPVQVVVLSDDPRVAAWASGLDPHRAAAVTPTRGRRGPLWS